MTQVALTRIRYGADDGTVIDVLEGDPIPKDIPKDIVEELKASEAIGEPPVTAAQADDEKATLAAENDALMSQVAELQKQLTEAKKTPAK